MHVASKLVCCSLGILLVSGCDRAEFAGARAPVAADSLMAAGLAAGRAAPMREAADAPAPASDERMLVQRGELTVETARPAEAMRMFLGKVKELGGHLSRQDANRVTVRVPAPQFDAAFAAASAAGRVLHESREANDVTEEYLDLGIRLETATKARARLLEVLQKAERVEDILKVEAEIRRLSEEIERLEGRRKLLADQVALATLTVTFQGPAEPPRPRPRLREGNRFAWIDRVGAELLLEAL